MLRDYTIRFAAAGVSHSIFVDSRGRVYTCGKGNGLLGHGDIRIRTVPSPVANLEASIKVSMQQFIYCATHNILQGIKIVNAAAGVTQSIFISAEGVGYWCGEGMGELKHVNTNRLV